VLFVTNTYYLTVWYTINLFANDKPITADVFPATKIYYIFSFNWLVPVKSFELLGSTPLFVFSTFYCIAQLIYCIVLIYD